LLQTNWTVNAGGPRRQPSSFLTDPS
jgi:hypothetical protein